LQVACAHGQTPATTAAIAKAREFQARAVEIDQSQPRPYDQDFVDSLAAFYRHGTGTAQKPSDPLVIRKFCREWVLSLLRDLFIVKQPIAKEVENRPDRGFLNPLDEESAKRFRGLVIKFLATADEDLDAPQRVVLYRVSELAFSANHAAALELLHLLAERMESDNLELETALIRQTIEAIKRRAD
jgi:hypothetical protein